MPSAPSPLPQRHIVCVVAARPNLMKMAPILAALGRLARPPKVTLVHTGQHYDSAMNAQYFTALDMASPDINLEVGSASHARQTAEVMLRFEPVLQAAPPSAVLVVGDVNSTLACALVAAKMNIAVIHVEAGLRSGDRAMPEEINRILTDQLAGLLFISEPDGWNKLLAEGIPASRMHLVGNVMIDTLKQQLPRAVGFETIVAASERPAFLLNWNAAKGANPDAKGSDPAWGLTPVSVGEKFALVTLHRPSNVDDPARLTSLLHTIIELSTKIPVLFPLHPRTRSMLAEFGLLPLLDRAGLLALPPQGYLEMLGLMRQATMVLTDSGGVQEETTALGVPCITLRANTERPITVSEGSNTLAGHDPATILELCRQVLRGAGKAGRVPPLWDGHAAERIAAVIDGWLEHQPAAAPGAA